MLLTLLNGDTLQAVMIVIDLKTHLDSDYFNLENSKEKPINMMRSVFS